MFFLLVPISSQIKTTCLAMFLGTHSHLTFFKCYVFVTGANHFDKLKLLRIILCWPDNRKNYMNTYRQV